MSNSMKLLAALGLVVVASACNRQQPEPVVVEQPAPIVEEPTYNKL